MGDYISAKKILNRVLQIKENVYGGTENILVAYAIQNLALAEWSIGNYQDAKNLFKKVFNIKLEHYQDPKHIEMSYTLQGLGLIEFSLGNYSEAKNLLVQDIAIRKMFYKSSNHISLGSSLLTLAMSYELLNNYDIALQYMRESYEILHSYYKERISQIMLADYSPVIDLPVLKKTVNSSNAKEYYKKALKIVQKIFGDKHHFVARYCYLLGQAYAFNGQREEAIKQYTKAKNIANNVLINLKNKVVIDKYKKNILKIESTLRSIN